MSKLVRQQHQNKIAHLRLRQRGQTMVFALVFIVVIIIGVVALFNTGQITRHKMEVQNAADAAAYSAAILTARELNFMAYTNRAMVANQVTLGQFAAFESWGKKYALGARGIGTGYLQLLILNLIHPSLASAVRGIVQASLSSYNTINVSTSSAMLDFSDAANKYVPFLQGMYVGHQKSLQLGTLLTQVDTLPRIIDDNAKGAMISNFGALAVFLSGEEQQTKFLFKGTGKEPQRRFAAFVNDSRDQWTTDRRRDDLFKDLGFTQNIGIGYLIGSGGLGYKVRGGSALRFLGNKEEYGWSSLDTIRGVMEFGVKIKFKRLCVKVFGRRFCWTPPTVGFPPFGFSDLSFAGAAAETTAKKSKRLNRTISSWKQVEYGDAWKDTAQSAREAIILGYQPKNPKVNYKGLPEYIDIDDILYSGVDKAPTFLVSVRKNADLLKTSDTMENNKKLTEARFDIKTKLSGGNNTVEGEPGNILGNRVKKLIEAYRNKLLASSKTPGGYGDAVIEQMVKQFEKQIKDKVNDIQDVFNAMLAPLNSADERGGVFALAAASVYFKNPDSTAKVVKGSTFSPHWQVRLIPVDDDIRTWSVISQGLDLSPVKSLMDDQHLDPLSIMAE